MINDHVGDNDKMIEQMLITGIFRHENVDVKWQPASCLATLGMGSRKTAILPTYMNGLFWF